MIHGQVPLILFDIMNEGENSLEFFYSYHYQKIKKTIASDFFQELVDWLYFLPTPPILREVKSKFPDKNVERMLEGLVDFGLIIRKERRYYLGFPIRSKEDQRQVYARYHEINRFFSKKTVAAKPLFLPSFLSIDNEEAYFYGVLAEMPQVYLQQLHHTNFSLLTVASNRWNNSLGAFFQANRENKELPEFMQLQQLLGDVDESYFLDQIDVILERIKKKKNPRWSIFFEALLQVKLLSDEKPPQQIVRSYHEGFFLQEKESNRQQLDHFSEFEKKIIAASLLKDYPELEQTIIIEHPND